MASRAGNELAGFHQFIATKLSEQNSNLSPEEALDLWRETHPFPDQDPDAVAAIEEVLAEIKASDRGRTCDALDQDYRHRGLVLVIGGAILAVVFFLLFWYMLTHMPIG
jgi:hypothetical protein